MKNMYSVMLDGELLPDMHILLFENITVALYSFLLLSIAYSRNDLKFYRVGSINNNGVIENTEYTFVCDINSILSVYDTYSNKDDVKNVSRDLFNKSLDALATAVKNKYNMEATNE